MAKIKKFYGVPVVSEATLKKREKKDAKPVEVTMPLRLNGFCRQGDLDRCPVHCGTCVEAGSFENIPRVVTYLV